MNKGEKVRCGGMELIGLAFINFIISFVLTGILLFKLTNNSFGRSFYVFFNGKYLLDIILNSYIIRGGMSLGYILSKYLDRGALEYLGPNGLTILNNNLSFFFIFFIIIITFI